MSQFTKINAHRLALDRILAEVSTSEIKIEKELSCYRQRIEEFGQQINQTLETLSGLPEDTAKFIAMERTLRNSNQSLSVVYEALTEKNPETDKLYQTLEECLQKKDIHTLRNRNKQTAQHLHELCKKVKTAHDQITVFEKKAVTKVVEESLKTLGYQTETDHSKDTLIRAQNKKQSIAVTVDAKAEVRFDMAGFDGQNCEREANQLLKQFEQRGLKVIQKQTQFKHPNKTSEFNPLKSNPVTKINRLIHYFRQQIKR